MFQNQLYLTRQSIKSQKLTNFPPILNSKLIESYKHLASITFTGKKSL